MMKWRFSDSKFFSGLGRRNLYLGALSGLLIGISYIPFPPWLVYICYVPLLINFQTSRSVKANFFAGWLAQFFLTLIGFHWVAHTAHEFGQLPWIVSLLALFSFAAFFHLHIPAAFAAAAWLRQKLSLKSAPSILVVLIFLIFFERYWPMIFPWHLGYTFIWAQWPIFQIADYTGFTGLSALIFLANGLFFYIWENRHHRAKAVRAGAVFVFVFSSLNFLGYVHRQQISNGDQQVNIMAVQANIGNLERVYAEQGRGYQNEIVRRYLEETRKGLEVSQPDAVIWPESAFPDYFDQTHINFPRQQTVRNFLRERQIPLMTGSFSIEGKSEEDDRSIFNAFFSINGQGELSAPAYRKSILLAFGEYLPFGETFPWLKKLVPFISSFGRGKGPQTILLETKSRKILTGPQICYEGLDAAFTRSLAIQGAQVLVNVTNDSWFGATFEPHQHLYMTLARSIETRLPLLRATNTGITTGILANGQILQKSPLYTEWNGVYNITYQSQPVPTVYSRFGNWDQWIYFLIFALIVIQGVRNVRSRQR